MHDPANRVEAVLGRLVALANPFFQIESLHHFNSKFFPRWQPRYLLYDGALALPRSALAALTAEGFVPRLNLAERVRRSRYGTSITVARPSLHQTWAGSSTSRR
jgi:lysyl-tRNA synthetase class 2